MGKSSLHEPSMSAMLAYLLSPHQDHGLGKKFLKSFLEIANANNIYSNFINNDTLKFEIELEVSYSYKNKRNDIDIQIKILDKSYKELHRIIIENKIRPGAATVDQLARYYEAVKHDSNNDDALPKDTDLSVIFLTPHLNHNGLQSEFENLETENKVWMYWNSHNPEVDTIVKLIQDILELEQKAIISPINEYMRHTLKAFTHYIIKTINITTGKNRVGEDIGEVKQRAEISIDNNIYTIILRDSGQIQLFNDVGDKVKARQLLRDYLKENGIAEGKSKTTRSFGNQIFNHLEKI